MKSVWNSQFEMNDEKTAADTIVNYFTKNNILPAHENIYDGFDAYRENIYENYNHGGFYTFISPEDEILIYVMSKIIQPKNAFVAGSYFGYWAVWAMKTISEIGGTIVLSDIDKDACALAKKNFSNLGYEKNTKVCCEDAVTLLSNRKEPVDMLMLDAMGNWNDPRPDYRGKRIYLPILESARHVLKKGSAVILHNMKPRNPGTTQLVEKLLSLNAVGVCYDTPAGIGVFIIA